MGFTRCSKLINEICSFLLDVHRELANEENQQALAELVVRFDPLIKSESKFYGQIDEDIAQDIRETLFRALKKKKCVKNPNQVSI